MLGGKLNIAPEKLQKRLWGDNFYDPDTKKWYHSHTSCSSCSSQCLVIRVKSSVSPTTGKKLQRGFCQFVLRPIYRLIKGALGGAEKREGLDEYLTQLGIELKASEKNLEGKNLMKCIMPKFLPLAPALLEMMVRHLPSPMTAQQYRVEILYEGPMDDECANAVRSCDKQGT